MTTTIRGALRATARLSAIALAATLASCGSDGADDAPIAYDRHLPMQVGDRWVYRQTMTWASVGSETLTSTETVTGTRQVNGATYHVVESLGAPGLPTVSLYGADARAIQARDPDDMSQQLDLVRFPAYAGGSFVQDLGPYSDADEDGDGRLDPYTSRFTTSVVGVESVSTPAGDFSGVLHVHDNIVTTTRMSATGTTETRVGTRDTWYAPGVGRVRMEVADGNGTYRLVDELMAHTPAGRPRQDTTAPSLVRMTPAAGTPVHAGAPLVLTFDEPVTETVLASVSVTDARGDAVNVYRTGAGDPSGRSVALSPILGWNEGTYTVRIAAGIQDLAGNTMGARPDSTFSVSSAFALVYTLPYRQGTGLGVSNPALSAHVNKTIDATTFATITLRENGTVVPVTVFPSNADTSFSLVPSTPLKPSTRYTVDLGGLRSTFGFALANPQDWTFTTAGTLSVGPQEGASTPGRRNALAAAATKVRRTGAGR